MSADDSLDDFRSLVGRLFEGEAWSLEEADRFMTAVMAGEVPDVLLAAALGAMQARGPNALEVAGFARATRKAARSIPYGGQVYDCVGTGGDGIGTFNISTTAALVGAAAGVPVAKHGNRSVSSRSGSADLLEALDIPIGLEPAAAAEALDRYGFVFLFAPDYHPGFANAAEVRRTLGVRTVFNLLGPLVNPADPKGALVGVFSPGLGRLAAEALQAAGTRRALVVHGNGMDELATTGTNLLWEVDEGRISELRLEPEDVGLSRSSVDELLGGSPRENAALTERILTGEEAIGPRFDVVAFNAGALLWVAGIADDLAHGVGKASDTLRSGRAREWFENLRRENESS